MNNWMKKILSLLVGTLSFALYEPRLYAKELTIASIQSHYRAVRKFEAEVEQTKTSPLLLRPLKSKVKLTFANDRLSWQPDGQNAWQLRFDKQGNATFLDKEQGLDQLPEAARLKLNRTMRLVRDLLTMDPRLDESFILALEGDQLTIKAKPNKEEIFFEAITLSFHANADLKTMNLRTRDDDTRLDFKSMKLTQ